MERAGRVVGGPALLLLLVGDVVAPIKLTASVSISAAVTLILASGFLLLLPGAMAFARNSKRFPVESVEPQPGRVPAALWIFLLWALADTAIHGITVLALQNLCCYFIFIGSVQIFAKVTPGRYDLRFAKAVVVAGWLRAVIYAAELVRDGFGASGVFNRRAFAIQALLIMSAAIPLGRDSRWSRLLVFVLFVEVVLSGSRTAMAAGALLLIFSVQGRGMARLAKSAIRTGLLGLAGFLSLAMSSALQDRFFAGDSAWRVRGIPLNTEGRAVFWSVVSEHAEHSPWTGYGAGSASTFIRGKLLAAEPHNDYLRLWHDFGYIGLALWVFGYLGLMVRCWQRARDCSNHEAQPHLAGFLALLGVGLVAITDNVCVYYFAMAPLGALVGMSLAQPKSVDERHRGRHLEHHDIPITRVPVRPFSDHVSGNATP